MKQIYILILFYFFLLPSCTKKDSDISNVSYLWYDKPAEYFTEALPIGNGRLAAMIYGRPGNEIIHLNEETLWTGGPVDLNPNPKAKDYIPLIRDALMSDDYRKADSLSHFVQGYFSQSYAPVGDLRIGQQINGEIQNYERKLDLNKGIVSSTFEVDNVKYVRESFVSYPDQVIVLKFKSSIPKKLSLSFNLVSELKAETNVLNGELSMSGRAPSHADPLYINTSDEPIKWNDDECNGMRFQTLAKLIESDGKCLISGDSLIISDASSLTMAISIATSFNGFDKCPVSEGLDEKVLAQNYLTAIEDKDYDNLKERHINDYKKYYDKSSFYLEGNEELEQLPTNERLIRYSEGSDDYGLEALLFNYGRYLLISSSRSFNGKGIPANLQGKWNKDLRPAWSCNFTVNINLQMNYWASDRLGLSDMALPLIDQIFNMSKTGEYTARNFFGCRGWAAGHNSDIWAITNPVGHLGRGDCQWANWYMASPWLCQYLWDRYKYSCDVNYLRNVAYPIMKSASEFCQDWLVFDKNGYLTTSPSTSPENRFKDDKGNSWAVTTGSTMDIALIRDLFKHTISASEILDVDSNFRGQLCKAIDKISPYRIGEAGNLQEWAKDYKDSDPTHRHVSHLYALHPGSDISLWDNPALFEACKKTLLMRGDDGTGWSRAWKICFWARLLDGNHAYRLLRNTLHLTEDRGFSEHGGTYPNMLNACPPFQIDGNFGILEGISEMLLQSHLGELHLLPALPDAWVNGRIDNVKARGGYLCSIEWRNSKLYNAEITSQCDTECKIRTNLPIQIKGIEYGLNKKIEVNGNTTYLSIFNIEKNKIYNIKPLYEN